MTFSKRTIFALTFLSIGIFSSQAQAQWFPTYISGNFTLGNDTSASSPYNLADTFFLESNPGASKTIYLDFDGHHSFNNIWGHNIVFDAFDRNGDVNNFSNSELIEIQRQFQNVAEDFIPFDVNVTTRDPGYDALVRSNFADNTYGVRVLNTQNVAGSGAGGGGTAYINSFNWIDDRDNVAFTFNKGANTGGMTNSHEVGHTLGLGHDGLGGQTYHPGVGSNSSPVSWGPIMGAPFGKNLSQWSNGDYNNSTNTQDDLAIITKAANGFDYRVDSAGATINDAKELEVADDGTIFDWNIIERNTDIDMFSFTAGPGQLTIDINPFQGRPNLDVLAKLFDSNGTLIATSNPTNDVIASFDLAISGGQYFLSIEGTGLAGVYSDYGSLGFYTIEGSAPSAVPEPATGTLVAALTFGAMFRRRRRS